VACTRQQILKEFSEYYVTWFAMPLLLVPAVCFFCASKRDQSIAAKQLVERINPGFKSCRHYRKE